MLHTEKAILFVQKLSKKYGNNWTAHKRASDGLAHTTYHPRNRIAFSEQYFEFEIKLGMYWDYPSVQVAWRSTGYWKLRQRIPGTKDVIWNYACPNFTGDMIVWAATLHEVAHLISGHEAVHGPVYITNLIKLIKENPYEPEFWEEYTKSNPKPYWEQLLDGEL